MKRHIGIAVAYGLAWCTLASALLDYAHPNAPWFVTAVVNMTAYGSAVWMARHRSIHWRLLTLRRWSDLQAPIVIDEDDNLRLALLPWEEACFAHDADGPLDVHVHTRSLVTGRPAIRGEQVWRVAAEDDE